MALYPEPFHDSAVSEVLLDNLVDVLLVNIAVPDRLGVHDHDGTLGTTIQTSRGVDAHLSLSRQAKLFTALLGVVTHRLCAKALTALAAIFTQVRAEENMVFEVGHLQFAPVRTSLGVHAILKP